MFYFIIYKISYFQKLFKLINYFEYFLFYSLYITQNVMKYIIDQYYNLLK